MIFEKKKGFTEAHLMYQTIPYHSIPIGINLLSNAILKHEAGSNYSITNINQPLPYNEYVSLL